MTSEYLAIKINNPDINPTPAEHNVFYYAGFSNETLIVTKTLLSAKLFNDECLLRLCIKDLIKNEVDYDLINIGDMTENQNIADELDVFRYETDAHITALHAAINNGDLATAKALIASYDNDQIPF